MSNESRPCVDPSADTGDRRETYSKQGIRSENRYHATRTASKQASFFLPHLTPGMSLLDCGCGPGTITLGLAEHLTDGLVTGIDLDESALAPARASAQQDGISNVGFETGGLYELPFANNSFDAVFSHAVLEHLSEPVAALQ